MYQTTAGDTWDKISYKVYGEEKFASELMKANGDKLDEFIFSAGEEIILPNISRETKSKTPPWRS